MTSEGGGKRALGAATQKFLDVCAGHDRALGPDPEPILVI